MGGKRKNSGSCCKTDDSGAKKSDDCDSQEELDCSDASGLKWNATNNGVRYSARVMEKQEKLRRESSPAKQIITDSSGQCALSVNTSPPGPGWKSVRSMDDSHHGSSEHGQHNLSSSAGFSSLPSSIMLGSTSVGVSEEKQRKKRNWELWSQDDKQLFFEALNDFGKDFDAIQNHLASKLRPKNKLGHCSTSIPVTVNQFIPKNKDQVRHFYYRTWNKISKFLTFPKDMKKAFQELYGLVNYGELRKKQRVLNMKTAAKLSELVEKGTTAIKVRGKTFRIKTPVCRALKRLNRLDDDVEHARVPCKVSLELNAKDGRAWAAVQAVSHNPRVKVYVPLQRTLASVISYFEERWKSSSDRLKEQLLHTFGKRAVPRLRFIPTEKRDMNLPIFKISEVTSSAKLSLRSFTENVLKETDKTTDLPSKNKKKQGVSNPDDSVTEAESDLEPSETVTPTVPPLLKITNKPAILDSSETLMTGLDSIFDKGLLSPDRQKQSSSEVTSYTHDNSTVSSKPNPAASDTCCCPPPSAKGEEDFLSHTWGDETIRRGWTVDDAGTMTCGELYLLLGQSDKLCFEYYWDNGEENSMQNNKGIKLIDRLVEVARLLKKRKSLTRSTSKSPWPVPCTKCGHKPELNPSNLRTPHPPINTQTHVNPHPSSTADHTVRFQSEEFHVPQSIYHDANEAKPQPVQRVIVDSGTESGIRILQESFISTRNTEYITDPNPRTFRCPRPIIPKETMTPVIMPPKPFLDLPKGNRRIGRPTLKRVVPRVLPLRPKTPEVGGMYAISVPGSLALRPVTHSSSVAPNLVGSQVPVLVKSLESQQINLLNCLKASPSTSPSEKNPPTDEGRNNNQPDGGICVGSNEFEDLLKVRPAYKPSTDPENSFSLSSFMDISITGSSSLAAAASACLNSDKFLHETAEQSLSCSLGLSKFLTDCPPQKGENQPSLSTPIKTLETPSFTPRRPQPESGGPSLPDGAWLNSGNTNDPNDLSLSRILGTFDAGLESNLSNNSNLPTSDVNFQSVVGEGSLNFLTKFSERTTKLSSSTPPDEAS